jgi:hypothetical protein
MKLRDKRVPVSTRRNETETVQTVFGESQPTKRCGMCRMELFSGVDFYQTREHESDYAVDALCYDLKKKYAEEWKTSKKQIVKQLRNNNVDHFETRKRVFESIFRNRGIDNLFDGV